MATILVIEDDLELGASVAGYLEQEGHHVVHLLDGQRALSCIPELRPDLVLLDVGLPEISGPEVIHRLRDRDPALVAMPIVLFSGARRLAAAGEEVGSSYALSKPCTLDELKRMIDRALRERRPPRPPLSADAFVG